MNGNYHRYLAELATGDPKSEVAEVAVDEPVVLQEQAPMIQKVLKTVEFPQVQDVDGIVDVPVVAQSQVPIVRTVQTTVEVPQSQFLDRVVDVPVVMQRQVPQEQIRDVEETDVPVPHVMEEITEVVKHMPQERVRSNTVEQLAAVPAPHIQEESVEVFQLIPEDRISDRIVEQTVDIPSPEDVYEKCYEQFGKCLKLGIHEGFMNRAKFAKLLSLNTSKSRDEQISLKGYVDHMKKGQNDIHYITGESIAVVSSSLFRECLHKKGYEALYMADHVDEYAVQQLKEFDGTKLKLSPKEGLDLGDQDVNMERIAQQPSGSQQQLREARQAVRQEREEGRKEKSEKVEGGEWDTVVEKRRKEEKRERKSAIGEKRWVHKKVKKEKRDQEGRKKG